MAAVSWRAGELPSHSEPARVELGLLGVQLAAVGAFLAAAIAGEYQGDAVLIWLASIWMVAFYTTYSAYVLRFRMRGVQFPWVERAAPAGTVLCISAAWIAMGEVVAPAWAIHLLALVAYARRNEYRAYRYLSAFIMANIVMSILVIDWRADQVLPASDGLGIIGISVAFWSVAHLLNHEWEEALRRQQLLAETDPLTGVANRRAFLDMLETVAVARSPRPFSVLMLDLDNFKQLNDEFGHLHGDEVLVHTAIIMDQSLRDSDHLARYGGEEFAAILPNTGLDGATAVAERIRRRIVEETPTSVSIGVASRQDGEDPEAVMRRADARLLEAKRSGKNLVRADDLSQAA